MSEFIFSNHPERPISMLQAAMRITYGVEDDPDNVEECTECGYDIVEPGRELCTQCFKDYHGPDDSDLDPECCGGFSIEVRPC
jgi:hypothetical protein